MDDNFPWEIKDVVPEESMDIPGWNMFECKEYVRVSPYNYLLKRQYRTESNKIYNMEIRTSDTFVLTFPRSGTTWTQELVWILSNDHDYETAMKIPLILRFPLLESSIIFNDTIMWKLLNEGINIDITEKNANLEFMSISAKTLEKYPSPRFIKTHLPFSLLPQSILDTAKVVYVARDPRDVAVSYYHYFKLYKRYDGEYKSFWHLFINDKVPRTPFTAHTRIKEAWEKRHHPNLLFLFYEELIKDLPAVVRRVANFLNKPATEEQVSRLCNHLSIENFRKNKAINREDMKALGFGDPDKHFIRKGKAGGWREYFDEEMTQQAERWMKDNLGGTGIHFPEIN